MSVLFSLFLMFVVGLALLMKLRSIAKLVLDDDFKKGMIWASILAALFIILDQMFSYGSRNFLTALILAPVCVMICYYVFLFGAKVIKWFTSI